jgi:hypothetical protein
MGGDLDVRMLQPKPTKRKPPRAGELGTVLRSKGAQPADVLGLEPDDRDRDLLGKKGWA